MVYQNLENLLKDIICEKIENKEAFTAFDITMISKKRGNDSFRHRDIKEIIHNIMLKDYMDEYNRELITIPGTTVEPFLYFPKGYNINDYVPMEREELSNFTVHVIKTEKTNAENDIELDPYNYIYYSVYDKDDDSSDNEILW